MTPFDMFFFFLLAFIAVASAVGMLLGKNAVYSALFLVMNFVTIALFYLMLDAPFLAMSQVTVYAGAIMVLFLFVIMLLGVDRERNPDKVLWQRPFSIVLAIMLLIETTYLMFFRNRAADAQLEAALSPDFGAPKVLALTMFNQYGLPILVIAILLLAAMIGVIALTKKTQQAPKV
ncbi:MAG: NADH-quinone oxidoreductase subunit J [Anaerolineales bacterium]